MTTSKLSVREWLNTDLYAFKHRYYQTGSGRIHYVDEGQGEPIVFVHGTPTWSFMYRELLRHLSGRYRCIALDHLGFGLSDKPSDFSGAPEDHARHLHQFLDALGLQKVTLVVHDFGGPIGLSYGVHSPQHVSRIILFNTWMWATKSNPKVRQISRLLNSWLGEFLYLRFNFSPKVLLKQGFFKPGLLSRELHKHYIAPFTKPSHRWGLLRMGRALLGSSDWYEELWRRSEVLTQKPCLILWGDQDKFFGVDDLRRWERLFKNAQVHQFQAGHFVMEEEPQACMQLISSFMSGTGAP